MHFLPTGKNKGVDPVEPGSINGPPDCCIYTDIQLKTLGQSLEVINMKIIMRRDSVIFYLENNRIGNAIGDAFLIEIKDFN